MLRREKSTNAESNREQNHVQTESKENDQGRAATMTVVSLKAAARFRTLDYGWDAPRPCGTSIALSETGTSEEQL